MRHAHGQLAAASEDLGQPAFMTRWLVLGDHDGTGEVCW
jgi:hypothetical protein